MVADLGEQDLHVLRLHRQDQDVGPGHGVRVREGRPDDVDVRELAHAFLAAARHHDLVRAAAPGPDQARDERLAHPASPEEGDLAIAGLAHPSAPPGRTGSISSGTSGAGLLGRRPRDARAQELEELPDPCVAPFGDEGLAVDQAGVELLAAEDVLEAFGDPVEHRGDHLDIDVVADLAATDPELDELEGPVRVLAPHQPVDRPPEPKPGVVPPDHRDPVGHPLLGEELLRPPEPVVQDGPEPGLDDVGGGVEPRRELPDRLPIHGEEQPLLVPEMQEDGPLGDPDLGGDVLDVRAPVPVLGEVPHRDTHDLLASLVGLGAGSGGHDLGTVAALRRANKARVSAGIRGAAPGHVHRAKKKNPRDLRLAEGRSLQPPLAPRAQVLRATSRSRLGFLAVVPFRWALGPPEPPHPHS